MGVGQPDDKIVIVAFRTEANETRVGGVGTGQECNSQYCSANCLLLNILMHFESAPNIAFIFPFYRQLWILANPKQRMSSLPHPLPPPFHSVRFILLMLCQQRRVHPNVTVVTSPLAGRGLFSNKLASFLMKTQ